MLRELQPVEFTLLGELAHSPGIDLVQIEPHLHLLFGDSSTGHHLCGLCKYGVFLVFDAELEADVLKAGGQAGDEGV